MTSTASGTLLRRSFACSGSRVDLRYPAEWSALVDGLPLPVGGGDGRPARTMTVEADDGGRPAGECVGTPKLALATEGIATVWRTPADGLLVRFTEPRPSVLRRLVTALLVDDLFPRGYHCLHAGAFAVRGRLVLIAGHSGAGKSTLSRAVHQALRTGLGENYALLDPDYRWTPLLRDVPADSAAAAGERPRLALVVVLSPGGGPPAFTPQEAGVLVDHSVSLHFSDLLEPGARAGEGYARALTLTGDYLAASAAEVWAFAYRPGIDSVDDCRERLLEHITGRLSHGS